MGTLTERDAGREDGPVTGPAEPSSVGRPSDPDEPPPWAAPEGPPVGSHRAPSSRPGGGFTWPFESVAEAAEWWYRPLVEARSWLALAHLFVFAVWGPVMFVIAVMATMTVFGLSFIGIGLLLVIPLMAMFDAFCRVERRRAEWIGAPITARAPEQRGDGYWSETKARLTDATRWRQVAFVAASAVVGPALFAVGVLPWSIVLQFAAGGVGWFGAGLGGLVIAVLLVGAAPRATVAVASVAHSYVSWFLGPDEQARLAGRVEELSTQRQQILEAVDGERRRIERNLHDGVQQQLVALGIDVARARARIDDDPDGARALLDEARDKLRAAVGELRLIGRGLHPAVLDDRGLDAALSAVVADSPIPISISMTLEHQLPDEVATTAYYIVSESVANILKHARARVASIRVEDEPGAAPAIRVTIHDDGRGGADAAAGSGLAGMRARVEGVDGSFRIASPSGGPTTIVAVIPLATDRRSRPEPGLSRV